MRRVEVRIGLLALFALSLPGQDPTQKMVARLVEEADAFRRLAPQVLGEERLLQRAVKPPKRFRPRVGNAAKGPPPIEWQERQIVSEYAFAQIGKAESGKDASLHELRRVISVDGKKIEQSGKREDTLARILSMKDEAKEKELLKDFERHGLIGAATDFGQLILLFTPRDIPRYEFTARGSQLLGAAKALVFEYRQTGGPDALTVFSKQEDAVRMKIQGEVWVQADNLLPLRITMSAGVPAAADSNGPSTVQEVATVDYEMSRYGALLPSSTEHKELRGGQLAVQNLFSYSNFHKFGASSDIRFDVQQP